MTERIRRIAPIRQTRPPAFEVPPGACDCHFHLFGPQVWYPIRRDFPVEFEDSTVEHYLHLQAALGLSRGLLVQAGPYGYNYQPLLHALHMFPGRFRGVAMLAPDATDAEIEILSAAGVVGLRFYPGIAPIDETMLARVSQWGWLPHYLLTSDEQALLWHVRILASPGDFVIEHSGLLGSRGGVASERFGLVLRLMDTGRCWIKLSPLFSQEVEPPFADTASANRLLVERYPHRVLWGSDWPHPSWPPQMVNDGQLLNLLAAWAPDMTVRNRILVDNPAQLLRLSA